MLRLLAVLALLCAATVTDLRTQRIPNTLNIIGLAIGVAFLFAAWLLGLPTDPQLVGALVAGGAMLLLYVGGGVGGGDVKLCAAIGLIIGWPMIVEYLFYGTLTALALILAKSAYNGSIGKDLQNVLTARPKWVEPGGADRHLEALERSARGTARSARSAPNYQNEGKRAERAGSAESGQGRLSANRGVSGEEFSPPDFPKKAVATASGCDPNHSTGDSLPHGEIDLATQAASEAPSGAADEATENTPARGSDESEAPATAENEPIPRPATSLALALLLAVLWVELMRW